MDATGPTLLRHTSPTVMFKPGMHSHNINRQRVAAPPKSRRLDTIRLVLILLGLCGIGFYIYSLADQYVYQTYENWAFEQQIAGRTVTFSDYVREKTPFDFLVRSKPVESAVPHTEISKTRPAPVAPPPATGSLLGKVEISRLNLSAMVREGVDAKTLSIAVGHVPSTALAGRPGNFAIAAHRDTLFRALKDIQKGDLVSFQSPSGTYTYQVAATAIVKPTDVEVLRPDGGGLIPGQTAKANGKPSPLLTMITCYPFYYVGSAPKRFIVEAKLVSSDPATKVEQARLAPPRRSK